MLGDPCPLGYPPDLGGDGVPLELLSCFGEEYGRLLGDGEWVIGSPFG